MVAPGRPDPSRAAPARHRLADRDEKMDPMQPKSRNGLLLAAAITAAEAVVVAKRRGSLLAVDTVVRCRDGHLFTTWWIPGVSVKSLRFGPWRLQRCPVGHHWSVVTPARASELTAAERRTAAEQRDVRLP